LSLLRDIPVQPGDGIFLISREQQKHAGWSQTKLDVAAMTYQTHYPHSQKILQSFQSKPAPAVGNDLLYVKTNQIDWLNILKSFNFDYLIFNGHQRGLSDLLAEKKQLNYWLERLVIQLPPFIPEEELPGYRSLIAEFRKRGVRRWQSSHFSHWLLFPSDSELVADTLVWTTNLASQAKLFELGYGNFTYSLEDDVLNIKTMADERGIMPVFGLIPLFISRIRPALDDQSRVVDANNAVFEVRENNGLYYTLGEAPVCLFHRREKLKGLGIHRFLIDFSFMLPSRKFFKSIVFDYQKGQKVQASTLFNHKTGFK
jgi:hypothetical protein